MAYVMDGMKRGKVLIFNGFRFQKNRETANNIYWRCWRKNCRTPLTTNVFDLDDEHAQINVLQVSFVFFSFDTSSWRITLEFRSTNGHDDASQNLTFWLYIFLCKSSSSHFLCSIKWFLFSPNSMNKKEMSARMYVGQHISH